MTSLSFSNLSIQTRNLVLFHFYVSSFFIESFPNMNKGQTGTEDPWRRLKSTTQLLIPLHVFSFTTNSFLNIKRYSNMENFQNIHYLINPTTSLKMLFLYQVFPKLNLWNKKVPKKLNLIRIKKQLFRLKSATLWEIFIVQKVSLII